MDWTKVPEPIALAHEVVTSVNQARAEGVQVDAAQVLAAKVASVALRSYFAQLVNAVERGEYDIDTYVENFDDGESGES